MRLLLLADIHANPWALQAIEQAAGPVDAVLFSGDTVNYGPRPRAAVQWLRDRDAVAVRGNHDHAVAQCADPRASPAKQAIALALRDWTRAQLDDGELAWLSALPLTTTRELGGEHFTLTHATPVDPLYDYRLQPGATDASVAEMTAGVRDGVLVVGHTHLAFRRRVGPLLVVNPGSAGQPLDGDARASFAIWEDGEVQIQRVGYDIDAAVAAVAELPIEAHHRESLGAMLRQGRTPRM